MVDFSLSVLPHLEPLAGVAFALNLAYIGLPRFRYRERIQDHVSKKLDEIDGEPHQFAGTDWYRVLSRLAALKDDSTDIDQAKLPDSSWAKGYSKIFEKHRDRKWTIGVSSFLGAVLALGSAHSAGHYGSVFGFDLMFLFGDASFNVWFVLLSLLAFAPVYLVARGNGVVQGACDYADSQIRDMKKAIQSRISNLEVPEVSDGSVTMSERDQT